MNPLLPPEIVKQIPVEFAPLLITGYHVPVKEIIPEEKLDEFLEQNPQYISVEVKEEKRNEIVEKVC